MFFQAHTGRLNSQSLLLEGSRLHSSGSRINLDLPKDLSYSLFPGQIVALEGMNSSGRCLRPISVLEGAPPPKATSFTSQLKESKGVKIVTMAGPYTTSDNLEYAPLVDAVLQISEMKPDVVILCGPFVDSRQPLVQECLIEDEDGIEKKVSHEYLFRIRVAELFSEMYENYSLETQIVLVPSVEDAFLDSVYPQPPIVDVESTMLEFGGLGLNDDNLKKRVHCVSNPATLKINELVIGVTSTDVLFHINCDSTSANLPGSGRLARMAQHLIQQRSYYPLFPAAKGACLDLSQQECWEMPVQPDILIVPSKLNPFVKDVMDSVVVNPGALTKNTTGGTFAVLDVHPWKSGEGLGEEDEEAENGVKDRVRVDIKRI
jgi:DNA polymerase alpha subunit B